MKTKAFGTIALFLLVLASATAAPAAMTTKEKFQKKLAKFTTVGTIDYAKARKGFCVCQEQDSRFLRAGVLSQSLDFDTNQVIVVCKLPVFSPSGGISGGQSCGTFVPLK